MKTALLSYRDGAFTSIRNDEALVFSDAQLVLGFGAPEMVSAPESFDFLKEQFPAAHIVLCSSSGEIYDKEVHDGTITISATAFASTTMATATVVIDDFTSAYEAGKALIQRMPVACLRLVLVLSDGGKVNGSELVKGMNAVKPDHVLITGGLAGDANRFEKTFVGLNDYPEPGKIVAIGFYGEKLVVSHGSLGGWEAFGLERTVTRSEQNIVYEIDHKNALELYINYLGEYAAELPGSALLFPLSLTLESGKETVVRTILSIDTTAKTMTFAGDLPEGSKVKFMRANFDKLIDAASDAAASCLTIAQASPKLALLISCVGRKIILGNRIDEEVEAVAELFGSQTLLTGFYSYGEISPLQPFSNCEFHNQTMTITGLNEME